MGWSILHTTVTQTPPLTISASGAGNTLIVILAHGLATRTTTSVSDNAGNIYVSAVARATDSSAGAVDIYYCQNCLAGATSISVVVSSGTPNVSCLEVSGLAGLSAVGVVSSGGSTTTPAGPTVSVADAGDFILATLGIANVTGTPTITSSGWVADTSAQTGFRAVGHVSSTSAVAGSYQPTWSANATGTYFSSLVTFSSILPSMWNPICPELLFDRVGMVPSGQI